MHWSADQVTKQLLFSLLLQKGKSTSEKSISVLLALQTLQDPSIGKEPTRFSVSKMRTASSGGTYCLSCKSPFLKPSLGLLYTHPLCPGHGLLHTAFPGTTKEAHHKAWQLNEGVSECSKTEQGTEPGKKRGKKWQLQARQILNM